MPDKAYLGRGWSFPPVFEKPANQLAMLEEEADIESSLNILVRTRPGERVMQPEYGCALDRLLFEPLTTGLKTYIRQLIRTAILRFEPRIDLESVDLDDTGELEGRVLITIHFKVRATNSRSNIVFPFYVNEGTNI